MRRQKNLRYQSPVVPTKITRHWPKNFYQECISAKDDFPYKAYKMVTGYDKLYDGTDNLFTVVIFSKDNKQGFFSAYSFTLLMFTDKRQIN